MATSFSLARNCECPVLDSGILNPDAAVLAWRARPRVCNGQAVALLNSMQSPWQDLRFCLRQIRKSPGFALTTVGTLALGIGATSAIFSLVNAVVLRPLAFPESDRLVWLSQADHGPGVPADAFESLSYPDFFDWRKLNHSFTGMASYRNDSVTLTGNGPAQHLNSTVVSSEFFRVLGVRPVLGRDLLADDEKPGAHVAMLSYQLWQSAFGGARDIAGRAITLDAHRYTVAGVMPASFGYPIARNPPSVWTTLADDAADEHPMTEQRGADMLDVVGRLKSGVSLDTARAEMSVICGQLAAQYPDTNKAYDAAIAQPLLRHLVGDSRDALRILFAAVGLVLLIACANVAGLLLARVSHRGPEIAVRTALGAGRGEIVRQSLVESLLLALCGGALGVILSTWLLDAILPFVPASLPRAEQISVDGAVLAFAVACSILSGLLFGVLPAWRLSRQDPAAALRDASRGVSGARGHYRLQNWLVVAETAIGLVLLVGSGLLIRSFVQVQRVDPGYDSHNVLTARLNLPGQQYTNLQKVQFYNRLLPQLATLPGVKSVAAGWPLAMGDGNIGISFQIEGRLVPSSDEPSEKLSIVTPDYFRAMRIPVLSGRAFTPRDDYRRTPVITVNQRFAKKYFPGENPIGKHIQSDLGDGELKSPMREVVAVVGNIKRQSLTEDPAPAYYLPYAQAVITSPTLAIRTAGDPWQLANAVRSQVAGLDAGVPLYRVGTLEETVYKAAGQPRFQTLLLACFAGMALLLSAVGLYAVLSYLVAQRTREIGLRMALGAQRSDVMRWILRRGLALASAGLMAGLAASSLLTRYLAKMLYRVEPFDPLTLAAVSVLLLAVSLTASALPAHRASRVDPMNTLREQ
jgi:predicted permease